MSSLKLILIVIVSFVVLAVLAEPLVACFWQLWSIPYLDYLPQNQIKAPKQSLI